MTAVLFIFSVVATLSHSDEILTCTRPDMQINALQNPNNNNFTRGFPGRRGPAGLKGEQGSKGEKGDPADNVDVSQLRERLARLEEQLQDVTSYQPYENCSQIFQQNLTSGFYETASLSRYMRKFEYCDLSDNAKGNFVRVPRAVHFPVNTIEGYSVVVTGEPIRGSPDWFEIAFSTDNETALIFKSRFDLNRMEFFTYIDGQFKHFDFRALPFAYNKYFKLKFYIDKNAFHVFLDDRHLADYNHRYRPISDVRKMLIYNSVSINRIWME